MFFLFVTSLKSKSKHIIEVSCLNNLHCLSHDGLPDESGQIDMSNFMIRYKLCQSRLKVSQT